MSKPIHADEARLAAGKAALIVEDDPAMAALYRAYLEQAGIEVHCADTAEAAFAALEAAQPSVILLDLNLPDRHGHTLLIDIRERGLDVPVIVVTSAGSISMAVESMRLGAYDFLVKPFNADRLRVTVRNALELRRLKRIERLQVEDSARFEGFIGASPSMQAVYRLIRDAARSKATVFVTGESGTGKELAAEAIHNLSGRAGRNFVALNCSAIPRDLVESELFGHLKGAFTGATANREGIAARADGGTLFLDEIGEMDLPLQAKLLRFIQTGHYQPVGSDHTRSADVRFVCATNRDPQAEIAAGRFREDLFYRLNVVPLALPPLRQRGSDIVLIARHYLQVFAAEEGKRFDGFDPEAEMALLAYPWPGNVRQLLNVLRNVAVLAGDQERGGVVTRAMLPPQLLADMRLPSGAPAGQGSRIAASGLGAGAGAPQGAVAAIRPLRLVERDAIETALAACDNNIARAAALLDIDASTIYRKRREWR